MVQITSTGDIGTNIDTYQFDALDCRTPDIFHVMSNIYAIAYEGPDADGWIKTVTIESNGDIGSSVLFNDFCGIQRGTNTNKTPWNNTEPIKLAISNFCSSFSSCLRF